MRCSSMTAAQRLELDPRPEAGERYDAYALTLRSEFRLATSRRCTAEGDPVDAVLMPMDEIIGMWSGSVCAPVLRTTMSDGCDLSVEEGSSGDHLVRFGTEGLFLISADLRQVACAKSASCREAAWQRVLLDWVMYFMASLRGRTTLHASAVAVSGRAVAFCGLSGGGKTTSAIGLIDRGGVFVCDDVLCLSRSEDGVAAAPGAPFLNIVSGGRPTQGLGRVYGEIGGERWVLVDHVVERPVPIGALFLLDRAPEHERMEFSPCSIFTLRQQLIGLPHLLGGERERFLLLCDLIDQARVMLLTAPDEVPPGELAEAVLQELPELASPSPAIP